MLYPQLLAWEVVESHVYLCMSTSMRLGHAHLNREVYPRHSKWTAGVKSARLRLTRSLAVIRSTCTNLVAPRFPSEGRGSRVRTTKANFRLYHQHEKEATSKESKCRGFPTGRENCIELVHFRDTETNDSACAHSLQRRTRGLDAPDLRAGRRRSFGAMFSFLQPRHGRNRLESTSSTSRTKSGVSTSGSEDGEVVEPGLGSESAPAVSKKCRPNPNLQRRIIAQDLTFPLYDRSLLRHLIVILLHPPMS